MTDQNVILLEADGFLTTSLKSILQNSNKLKDSDQSSESTDSKETSSAELLSQIEAKKGMDWDVEFKNKIKGTKAEEDFIKLYFETEWENPEIAAKILKIGAPLIRAFKGHGFSASKNPFVSFLKQEFVIKNFLLQDLITSSIFGAIHQALLARKLSPYELLRTNDYNIIYCPDFYKKGAGEVGNYLKLQSEALISSKPGKEEIQENRELFFGNSTASAHSSKLRSLNEIRNENENIADEEEDTDKNTSKAVQDAFIADIKKLVTSNQLGARDVVQYLGIITQNTQLLAKAANMASSASSTEGLSAFAKYLGKRIPSKAEIEQIIQVLSTK